MSNTLPKLFKANKQWAEGIKRINPDFFEKLAHLQAPDYLWIGCADSRVPANDIVGLLPGELFVHRNVANVVSHTDFNCLSVLQFAVEKLEVKHVIVCGHYGCGGVIAALKNKRYGLIDNWLRHVQDVREKYARHMDKVPKGVKQEDRLCELNVIEQAVNVCQTTIVQDAWKKKQNVTVHGWIYRLTDGLLHDLGVCISSDAGLAKYYDAMHKGELFP